MTAYFVKIEDCKDNYPELSKLYQRHYDEMTERLAGQGVAIAPFNPQLDKYWAAAAAGRMIHYCLRGDGVAVGYSNIYIFNDMHNGELSAREDTIYVLPNHRNGIGRRLSKFILDDLGARGVKRLHATAMTDLRVEKLWKRMGFKPVATAMIYDFEVNKNVST